ncbi:YflJ family protein [Priestia filamentosa]
MAHIYSKGWFIKQLKAVGISKHEDRKLETYKTHILANLYEIHVEKKR